MAFTLRRKFAPPPHAEIVHSGKMPSMPFNDLARGDRFKLSAVSESWNCKTGEFGATDAQGRTFAITDNRRVLVAQETWGQRLGGRIRGRIRDIPANPVIDLLPPFNWIATPAPGDPLPPEHSVYMRADSTGTLMAYAVIDGREVIIGAQSMRPAR